MTFLTPELARLDGFESATASCWTAEGNWSIRAEKIIDAIGANTISMVMDFPTYQQIKSLRAGSNVTLAESEGSITTSAADAQEEINAIEADLTALGARATTLEGTTQPMLTNGPQPDPPGS